MINEKDYSSEYYQVQAIIHAKYPELIASVVDDCLVVQVDWMQTTRLNPNVNGSIGLTKEEHSYRLAGKILNDKEFATLDIHVDKADSVGLNGIQINRSMFMGETWTLQSYKVLGVDGVERYSFTNDYIKRAMADAFAQVGFKQVYPARKHFGIASLLVSLLCFALAIYDKFILTPEKIADLVSKGWEINTDVDAFAIMIAFGLCWFAFGCIFFGASKKNTLFFKNIFCVIGMIFFFISTMLFSISIPGTMPTEMIIISIFLFVPFWILGVVLFLVGCKEEKEYKKELKKFVSE